MLERRTRIIAALIDGRTYATLRIRDNGIVMLDESSEDTRHH